MNHCCAVWIVGDKTLPVGDPAVVGYVFRTPGERECFIAAVGRANGWDYHSQADSSAEAWQYVLALTNLWKGLTDSLRETA